MTPKKKKPTVDEDIVDIESDIAYDDTADLDTATKKIKKLKKELAECKEQSQEYLSGWQRLRADVANSKRGDSERTTQAGERAKASIVEQLLPILDSYDMARAGSGWQEVDTTWRSGIEQIFNQLDQVLKGNGAERFGAVGETFDPRMHEAAAEVPAETPEQDNTIATVLRSGWKLGDTILRPAHVTVAHSK